MQIILHAGTWKTGSTAIQAFLKANREALAARGVFTLAAARERFGHHDVYERLTHGDPSALIAELKRLAAANPAGVTVITSEHFWPLRADEVARVADRLRAASDDLRVLFYLRPQEEMWTSLYAQQAKSFQIRADAPRWGTHDYMGGDVVDRALWYATCLELFEAAFGRDRIDLRPFDRRGFPQGDAVRDFLSCLGLEDMDGLVFDGFDRNPSFGWKAVALSVWFGREGFGPLLADNPGGELAIREAFQRAVAEARRRFGDGDWLGRAPDVFSGEEMRRIRAHYAADNARLFARYFGGRDIFGPVRETVADPLEAAAIPAAESAFARKRFLLHLMRAGLATGAAEAALIPDAGRRARVKAVERSPLGWLDRRVTAPLAGP